MQTRSKMRQVPIIAPSIQTRSKTKQVEETLILASISTPNTTMQTRSKTRQIESQLSPTMQYEVSIDFDDASRAWRANKRQTSNGTFVYVCEYVLPYGKKGYKCNKRCMVGTNVCYVHRNKSLADIANTTANVDSSDSDSS